MHEFNIEEIMSVYMNFVYTIVNEKLSSFSRQDKEECVSDIFYEVYKSRNSIDLEKGSLKAYIAVLSKRKAIDAFRRLCKNSNAVSFEDIELISTYANDNTVDFETREVLLNEIKLLGEPDSQIIISKYYFGHSAKTISKALGLKTNTVNKRASRALIKLKEALGGAV
jgi:RNA polymerase sigma-70 factor (ECF subfamily)